jgi:hypothetical protein
MSGPRASGSQTCKPSFALLHHEVAPRADKSIRVHERHDNRHGEALRTRFRWQRGQDTDPRPLGYEPTSRHLSTHSVSNAQVTINRPSQPSRRISPHRGSCAAFRSQIRSRQDEQQVQPAPARHQFRRCWRPIRWRCAVRAGTARPTSCWARQASVEPSQMRATRDHRPRRRTPR